MRQRCMRGGCHTLNLRGINRPRRAEGRVAPQTWTYARPGPGRVLYQVKAGIPVWRRYSPQGSMEPYWLRLINQANFLVRVNSKAVEPYLRLRLGIEVRLGPYLWMDHNELIHLESWLNDPMGVCEIRPPHREPMRVVGHTVAHAPKPNVVSVGRGNPRPIGGKLFTPLGRMSGLSSGNVRVQALLGLAKSKYGIFNIPSRYASYMHVQPWLLRTKVKRLKPLDLMKANFIRLHYYSSVVCRNNHVGARAGLHQSYSWSFLQDEMEVFLHSGCRSQYRHAAHGLYRKLNVLLFRN